MIKQKLRDYLVPSIFAVTIFTLALHQGNAPKLYKANPFELLFCLLFILTLLDIPYLGAISLIRERKSVLTRYAIILGSIFVFVIIGSILSFPLWAHQAVWVYLGYASLVFAILVFLLTTYITIRHEKVISWGLFAMAISPLVFLVAFSSKFSGFFINNARLIGAQNDPNITAIFIATGVVLSSAFFLYSKSRFRLFGAIDAVLLMPLFLWSDSRGASLSAAVILIALVIYYLIEDLSWKRMAAAATLFCIISFSVPAAYFILPENARVSIYQRSVAPTLKIDESREFVLENWVYWGDDTPQPKVSGEAVDSFSISRGNLWGLAIKKIAVSPFGLGPAYHAWDPIDRDTGAHNTWLQIALTSGWGGFLSWLILIYLVFRAGLQIVKRKQLIGVMLLSEFVFLLLALTFIDAFTHKLLWLIMGMIVGYSLIIEKDEKTKGIGNSPNV